MSVEIVSALFHGGVPAAMEQLERERFEEATAGENALTGLAADERKMITQLAGTYLVIALILVILYLIFVFWVTGKATEGLPYRWMHYIIVFVIGGTLGAKYMLAWPVLVFVG